MPDVEIVFVRTVPVMGFRGGGSLGQMVISHVEVSPRAMFEYGLRVTDPARLAVAVIGQSMDQDALVQWVNAQVLAAAKTVIAAKASIMVKPEAIEEVATATRASLEPLGLAVSQLASLNVNLSEDDLARLQAATKAAAEAKRAAMAAAQAPQPASPSPGGAPLAVGSRASVVWSDGNRYVGTIRQHQNGYVEIVWDNQSTVWVLPTQIQPA
jgi:hypothetical protein